MFVLQFSLQPVVDGSGLPICVATHRALATQKKLAYLGFQCFDHPPYSPDLVPSDYHLFPGLKKQLKCRHFSSEAEVIAAAETWLDGQYSDILSDLQN